MVGSDPRSASRVQRIKTAAVTEMSPTGSSSDFPHLAAGLMTVTTENGIELKMDSASFDI